MGTLEELGITREEILKLIVARAYEDLDYEEFGHSVINDLAGRVKAQTQAQIDGAMTTVLDNAVQPIIQDKLETLVLQETTKWGEKVGKPLTFLEYAILRAEYYMNEPVNYEGKPRTKDNEYGFQAKGNRIAFAVEKFLYSHIEQAMKTIMADANNQIVGGIEKTVKMKLAEISAAIKINMKTS